MTSLRFLVALLAVPVLGAGAAFHPSLRRYGALARAGAALALGTVALTLTALALTLAGIAWTLPALAAPPLAASLILGVAWSRVPAPAHRAFRPSTGVAAAAGTAAGLSLLLLAWTFLAAEATSVDLLFFWGVKAARFAQARGIDTWLLGWPYFSHAVPEYPPAVPVVLAWAALAAGRMPWRLVPVTSLLWLAAALPLLVGLLRRRLTDDAAAAVGAFWVAALGASLAHSVSGGNAEAPLLFFESVAVAALLVEDDGEGRFLPALMLAAAALTKVEGSVAALLVVAGAAARDALAGRRRVLVRAAALLAPAVLAVAAWFFFQSRSGLEVGYRSHGGLLTLRTEFLPAILVSGLSALQAGTFGLSWAIPIVLLAAARPALGRLLPALALVLGLFAFLAFDYMHDTADPSERIGWTAPRVLQPALSACILAAGLASLGGAGRPGRLRDAEERPSPP